MSSSQKASRKEIFGWCIFDFANSAYTTVIITAIFAPIFTTLIVPPFSLDDKMNPHSLGNTLWAAALAVSYGIAALLGPFLGAITDFSPKKKRFLFYAYIGCSFSTACLWFVEDQNFFIFAFLVLIVSNTFFCLSENFISSFLPHLASKKDIGKISGYAWGIGYFGGMLAVLLVRLIVGESTLENYGTLRLVGPLTALFFLLAGIPTFLFVKEPKSDSQKEKNTSYFRIAYKTVLRSLRDILQLRDLSLFLIVLFFSTASLQIVIAFAFVYGIQEIGLSSGQEAAAFVLMNLTAALGSFLFGRLQGRWGALPVFMLTLLVWITSIFLLFYIHEITLFINSLSDSQYSISAVFTVIASFAGLCLGSTQSSGRSIIALFSPKNKSGEIFGIWGLSGKAASLTGLLAIAFLQQIFGLHNAMLGVGVFFFISLCLCFFVNEKRGIQAAKIYRDSSL